MRDPLSSASIAITIFGIVFAFFAGLSLGIVDERIRQHAKAQNARIENLEQLHCVQQDSMQLDSVLDAASRNGVYNGR